LVRALANSINKEIWRAFLNSKPEYNLIVEKAKVNEERVSTEAPEICLKFDGHFIALQFKAQ
jgi:hypothetical protein